MSERCPHCGHLINAAKVPLCTILSECGMIHKLGECRFDFRKMQAKRLGNTLRLTKTSWRILAVLVACEGEIVSRDELLAFLGNYENGNTRTIDTFVAILRRACGGIITTHHGFGYSINKK